MVQQCWSKDTDIAFLDNAKYHFNNNQISQRLG